MSWAQDWAQKARGGFFSDENAGDRTDTDFRGHRIGTGGSFRRPQEWGQKIKKSQSYDQSVEVSVPRLADFLAIKEASAPKHGHRKVTDSEPRLSPLKSIAVYILLVGAQQLEITLIL